VGGAAGAGDGRTVDASGSAPGVHAGQHAPGTAQEDGDLAAGFKNAAFTVDATYSTQVQTHTSLETHGCVCEWNATT
jgi:xanthine dehydrogenase YagR molybdenum-binding subunit